MTSCRLIVLDHRVDGGLERGVCFPEIPCPLEACYERAYIVVDSVDCSFTILAPQ
jgi:hypothetical protein